MTGTTPGRDRRNGRVHVAGAGERRAAGLSVGPVLRSARSCTRWRPGRRAFQKKTAIDTLAAILNEEPEAVAAINPQVPAPAALDRRAVPGQGAEAALRLDRRPRARPRHGPGPPIGGGHFRGVHRSDSSPAVVPHSLAGSHGDRAGDRSSRCSMAVEAEGHVGAPVSAGDVSEGEHLPRPVRAGWPDDRLQRWASGRQDGAPADAPRQPRLAISRLVRCRDPVHLRVGRNGVEADQRRGSRSRDYLTGGRRAAGARARSDRSRLGGRREDSRHCAGIGPRVAHRVPNRKDALRAVRRAHSRVSSGGSRGDDRVGGRPARRGGPRQETDETRRRGGRFRLVSRRRRGLVRPNRQWRDESVRRHSCGPGAFADVPARRLHALRHLTRGPSPL